MFGKHVRAKYTLHQAETGVSVEEVCRKTGVSQTTFYAWQKK